MDKFLHIIPRSVAKERGMKRYFTGKPCKRGHVAERQLANGACCCETCAHRRVESSKEYQKQWYRDNQEKCKERAKHRTINMPAEKKREQARQQYLRDMADPAKRERKLAESRRWKHKNKDRIKEYKSYWYSKNKIQAINYALEYARKHPDKRRANINKRRSSEGEHTAEDIKRMLREQRHHCAACNANLHKTGYHVDHIQPLARGGTNWPDNLQILCPTCNLSKGAKDPIEWAQQCGRLI